MWSPRERRQGVDSARVRTRSAAAGLGLAAALLAGFCGLAPVAAAEGLRVGTSGDYAPFSFTDSSGRPTGFDIDLIQRLGEDLGRPVELVAFRWPDLSRSLRAERFDLAASGVTIRADRLLAGSFSRPYAFTGATVLIRKTDRGRFASLEAIDAAETRIAVNRGGHLEAVTRSRFARARVETVEDNRMLPALLAGGAADALVTDSLEARHFLGEDHSLIPLPAFTRDRKAILVRADRPELLDQVDRWFREREDDGWLNALRRRWFGDDGEVPLATARIEAVVALLEQRLALMPYVAAAKRRRHRAVEDRAQEARVLARARQGAEVLGLAPGAVSAVFVALIEASKSVQDEAPAAPASFMDVEELRRRIAHLSARLLPEIRAALPHLCNRDGRDRLRAGLQALEVPGLTSRARSRISSRIAALASPAACAAPAVGPSGA